VGRNFPGGLIYHREMFGGLSGECPRVFGRVFLGGMILIGKCSREMFEYVLVYISVTSDLDL